ncbi:TadE/TadG family type IV pilus assembly protein [Paenibacillus sp. BR2-3]|uniref:pilus assembly protein n=1 Tax=Paenibacillus sp. BR2-3 TaxID=3048494 RepID=UPI0039779D0B
MAEKNEGSMVVEAAMVLPMFLLFVLFLIFIVQMTLYSTALQSTVSDTVKVISTHMYPLALAAQKSAESSESPKAAMQNSDSNWSIPRLSVTDWSEKYASSLPTPLDLWAREAVQKGEGPLQELQAEASQSVLDIGVKPLLKPYVASDMLEYDRIHVSNVIVPEIKEGTRPYFGLEVSYELPMKVPFLNQSIVLEASAVERLWIGDTGEDVSGGEADSTSEKATIVVLEKPNPGVANKQGRIRAKIPPNASANLTIFYKSGKSSAKYLGWKQADENGYIEWEWKIGVNTTPGSWPFTIQTEDGKSIEVTFDVVKQDRARKGG